MAVVLVEQHVDLALDVADRAYFLERGSVRFAGPAADLRGRTDLLRAVFFAGVDAS
jgi:branched-chain amino acid transport system ATP-binding protein